MSDSCESCRFAAPSQLPDKLECRHNPPVDTGRKPMAEWPRVYPDGWCGQYEAKPATKPVRKQRPAVGEPEVREQG